MSHPFASQIRTVAGQPSSVRIGTVISAHPLQVTVQGTVFQDVGLAGLGSVGVGDTVALLGQSNASSTDATSWLCLGVVFPNDLGTLPIASLRQTVAQNLPTGAATPITFNVADIDTVSGWTPALPSRYTSRVPGRSIYQVSGGGSVAANGVGVRTVQFHINGVAALGSGVSHPSNAGLTQRMASRTMHIVLAENDFVEITIFQNSGGLLPTVVAGTEQSTLDVRLVGRL